MADYHIDIFWSEEDQAHIANLPDFEFCSAHGDTPEDALRELLIAKEAWLQVAREHGVRSQSRVTSR
jgi:predicted RNase H-like HicB family nuclease